MSEKILSPVKKYTVDDYLKFKQRGESKREYYNGKVVENTASSRHHNIIGSNTTIAVGSRLRGHGCEIYVNDMLIKLGDKSFGYPDIAIVKDSPQFEQNELEVLINPTIVIEILSPESLYHDKTEKLDRYLALASVRETILIREDEMLVEHYTKQAAGQWIYRIYRRADDNIMIDSINCRISLAEVYAQIKFV